MTAEDVVAVQSGGWVVVDCALYNGHSTCDVPVLIRLDAIVSAHPYLRPVGDPDLTWTMIRLRSGDIFRARVPMSAVTGWLGV